MHLSIFGKDFIILSNFEAARDLMDKRSAIYSDRPRFVLLVEMCLLTVLINDVLFNWLSLGSARTEAWLFCRTVTNKESIVGLCTKVWVRTRYCHIVVYKNTRLRYFSRGLWRPLINSERMWGGTIPYCANNLSSRLLSDVFVSFTAGVLLQLTYGHRVISMADDKYVQLSETALKGTIDSGSPGLMPVDLFPVCQPCLEFEFFFFSNFFVNSKVSPSVVARDGLQKTCQFGAQRSSGDEIYALRYGKRKHGQSFRLTWWKCVNFCVENWFLNIFGVFPDRELQPWWENIRRRWAGYQGRCYFTVYW